MNRTSARVARLVAAVLLAGSVAGAGSAARADGSPEPCMGYEVAYGITAAGALVEHDYCTAGDATGGKRSREVASAGWWLGGEVVATGWHAAGGALIASDVYQVARDGTLLWYTDGGEGRMGPGQRVPGDSVDWRQYHSLFSTGDGAIWAVDAAGHVLSARRFDYYDLPSSWSPPSVFASGFTQGQRLAGEPDGEDGFLGTDPAHPFTVTYWSLDGRVVRREPVLGLVSAPSWVDGGTAYARTAFGRIARLTPTPVPGLGRVWVPDVLRSDDYVRVFAGGTRPVVAVSPWEWQ